MNTLRWIVLALVLFLVAGCSSSNLALEKNRDGVIASTDVPEVHDGHAKASHGDAKVGLVLLLGIFILAVVVVDIIILPATAPCHRSFCCTTTVVHHCCH